MPPEPTQATTTEIVPQLGPIFRPLRRLSPLEQFLVVSEFNDLIAAARERIDRNGVGKKASALVAEATETKTFVTWGNAVENARVNKRLDISYADHQFTRDETRGLRDQYEERCLIAERARMELIHGILFHLALAGNFAAIREISKIDASEKFLSIPTTGGIASGTVDGKVVSSDLIRAAMTKQRNKDDADKAKRLVTIKPAPENFIERVSSTATKPQTIEQESKHAEVIDVGVINELASKGIFGDDDDKPTPPAAPTEDIFG